MLSESRCQTFSNPIPTSEAINVLAFVPKISTKDENLFWFGYRENSINSAPDSLESFSIFRAKLNNDQRTMKYYITKFIKDFRRPRFVLSFDETLDRPVVLVL